VRSCILTESSKKKKCGRTQREVASIPLTFTAGTAAELLGRGRCSLERELSTGASFAEGTSGGIAYFQSEIERPGRFSVTLKSGKAERAERNGFWQYRSLWHLRKANCAQEGKTIARPQGREAGRSPILGGTQEIYKTVQRIAGKKTPTKLSTDVGRQSVVRAPT